MKKNKNKFNIIILTLIVLLTVFSTEPSYGLPQPSYDFYVYDGAGVLDDFAEKYIIEVNKELSKKTGAQVVVATINSLESLDINSYAIALFENWKIGSKEYDNGVLILLVPSERDIWIEVGYGLEGALPDGRVKRIINDDILPQFSLEDYSSGVISGLEQLLNNIEEEYDITISARSMLEGNFTPGNNSISDNSYRINI